MDGNRLERVANQTWASQNKKELFHLLTQVEKINPKTILEVGTWRGWLLETFESAFPMAEHFLGIELDPNNVDLESVQGHTKISILQGDSQALVTLEAVRNYLVLHKIEVDFLFIDGDHTYEAVKNDFYFYSRFVRKGGIIALHDASLIGHPLVHVHKFWDEIKDKYKSELITGPDGTGTGILYL